MGQRNPTVFEKKESTSEAEPRADERRAPKWTACIGRERPWWFRDADPPFCSPFAPLRNPDWQITETRGASVARQKRHERLNSLWTIGGRFPKLDVAGSSPVSRSIFNNLRTFEKHTLHSPPLSILSDRDGRCIQHGLFKLLCCRRLFLDAGFRVHVQRHTNAWPRWSADTFGSTLALWPRLGFVRRITWKST